MYRSVSVVLPFFLAVTALVAQTEKATVRGTVTDSTGAVVVLVEQHVQLALDIADGALVLVHGDTVLRGAARDLTADPDRLEAAYLGARTG